MASPGIRLRAGLQNLNCSVAAFSALAAPMTPKRISQQLMNQIVNGQREFDTEQDAQTIFRVLDTMAHLQETVTPRVPIDWSNVLELKDTLTQTFKNRLNEEDPITTRCWYIRLSLLKFLQRMRGDVVVDTVNYHNEGVAFTDQSLAEECVRRLNVLNVSARTELLTAPRRKSTITVSLEEIGFKPESAVVLEPESVAVQGPA
jgi:hypothetical protein